jgi:thiol-disulfide isomerase/thioredoxin
VHSPAAIRPTENKKQSLTTQSQKSLTTRSQNLDSQRDVLKRAGCEKMIEGMASGGDLRRFGGRRMCSDLATCWRVAVARLAGFCLRIVRMRQYWMIVGLITLGITTTLGAVGPATGSGDEPKATARTDDLKPAAKAGAERPEPPLAEKLDRLKVTYEDAFRAYDAEVNRAKAAEIRPDLPAVARRLFDLAAIAPKDPAVRDGMLWMIEEVGRFQSEGPYSGEFAVAANWLVLHFGDDPDAVRVGLEFNWQSANRDTLLLNFYASAKGRESKGLARLALAQYLERKAMRAEGARKMLSSKEDVARDGDYPYLLHLKQCDVNYLRAEAQRLYDEVIAEYGDVPYFTTRDRLVEALLKQPKPKWNGQPLTDEDRRRMEAAVNRRRRSTLGQVAEAQLDDWHNLAVGKPAPEIKGVDVHGQPLTLSDYRGKVVALVFWGTWCGPCMREIPSEKALVERMRGRPFAMLGVDTDADAGVARKVMEVQGVTWSNWHDRAPGLEERAVLSIDGPIARLYHVRGYPTVYVIDAEGKIRSKTAHGDSLDQLVERLVAEREAPGHRGRIVPPQGRGASGRVARWRRRRGPLYPGLRDGPAPAERGMGTASLDESRAPLAAVERRREAYDIEVAAKADAGVVRRLVADSALLERELALALTLGEIVEDFLDIARDACDEHSGRCLRNREQGAQFSFDATTHIVHI